MKINHTGALIESLMYEAGKPYTIILFMCYLDILPHISWEKTVEDNLTVSFMNLNLNDISHD